MTRMLAIVAAIGLALSPVALASQPASASPDITCSTAYYLVNDYWVNQSYAQPQSPYVVYMSTNQGPTKFCLQGSSSSKTFEQYGTSRCINFEPTGAGGIEAQEGDCSLARAHWTLTLNGHVYTIKNNYTGTCMFDGAGTATIRGQVCQAGNGQEQFRIA